MEEDNGRERGVKRGVPEKAAPSRGPVCVPENRELGHMTQARKDAQKVMGRVPGIDLPDKELGRRPSRHERIKAADKITTPIIPAA